MENAQAVETKVMTALTCWKCGAESLLEAAGRMDSISPKGEKIVAESRRHSDCQKCGAYSVNAEQARHNKTVGRKTRKAIIKEANRKLS